MRQEKLRREEADGQAPGIGRYLNTVICGDAAGVLPVLPTESIDLVVTSPPYNFGHRYAGDPSGDTRDWNEYFAALDAVWRECARVLKPGGRIAVNIQPLFSEYVPTHHLISRQLLDLGLLWKAEILWEKHNYNAKYTAWGSWKSPSMPYLKYTWEFIEVFAKETRKKAGNRRDIDITGAEFKEWVIARWSFPSETRMKDYGHPAMFPEELPRRLLKLFSYRGDLVLDPFNGAGTTTLAACRNGRRFIGIDISAEYCRVAMARLQAAGKGKKPCGSPPPRCIRWTDGRQG
ncbi:site-specific DNA-methyltransferase [Methanoculleus sp. FWC-SCC1]|uniref:Type II methyltransferase n=1 Tax=Methanoculleus frigidifontis TaxID=2584085 RepID=A0ABT8MAR7_9EURY|nr:site-specific DNA-methyltransferase [Methanoculleus sp. FWC-SCC1]MDN7025031.1 site-specific DNA-methyltransferase [Methanoculleus sp. FWC-SCC1]